MTEVRRDEGKEFVNRSSDKEVIYGIVGEGGQKKRRYRLESRDVWKGFRRITWRGKSVKKAIEAVA